MPDCEIVIIGAGLIGTAIAERLSRYSDSLYILEKNSRAGLETSSRNSEVIHSGLYYPKNSLKHTLCLEGNKLLREYCSLHSIPCKKIGKLIIANSKLEKKILLKLYENGKNNNVNLEIWNREQIQEKEPHIKASKAIYSANTGIIDSHSLLQKLIEKSSKAEFVFNKTVQKMVKEKNNYKIFYRENDTSSSITTKYLINTAGLRSDSIVPVGFEKSSIYQYYFKGNYYYISLPPKVQIHHLIYPVVKPGANHLGIHLTKEMGGSYKLGPDSIYISDKQVDYSFSQNNRTSFYKAAKKYLPWLKQVNLSPGTVGIRPKLSSKSNEFKDFYIREERSSGFPNYFHLAGIDSPGLTASLAIARYVEKLFLKNSV